MATFGKTDIGGSFTSHKEDVAGCTGSPAGNGNASKITVYMANWAAGEAVKCALYDAADESFIASTEERSTGGAAGWYDFEFNPVVPVLASKTYRIAFYSDDTFGHLVDFYYDSAPGETYPYESNAGWDLWPDPVETDVGKQYSIYCTYSEGTVLSLAGTVAGTSTVTGTIGANPVTVSGLAGTSAGTSSITGAIGANPVTVPSLAGTVAGTSSVTGAVGANAVTITGLAGTVAGTSSITGAIASIEPLSLAGTVAGTSSVTGAVADAVTITTLAGTVAGTSNVTGILEEAGTILGLVGIVAGTSTVTGKLISIQYLIGTVAGISSVSGELSINLPAFPKTRPAGYDPDLVFDEDTGTWVSDADLLTRDGSRYHQQLVTVCKDLIYYESVT